MFSAPIDMALFFDFDNTISIGDVLDSIIERYSRTNSWRDTEAAWQAGRISTQECLRQQIGDLRVSETELKEFVADIRIDPVFARIVEWAGSNDIELMIVSDNASMLIQEILRTSGLPKLQVFANEIEFSGDQPRIMFPLQDAACPSCAHCKAQHVRRLAGRTRIYVGDGLSDLCPALVAEVVFAKDSLAANLTRRGIRYQPFQSLGDVFEHLESHYGSR